MSWSAPPTVATGDLATAAWWNQYGRDNFLETAPAKVTTQGDIVYATGANALARLAKGTALQALLMNSGATAPEWGASLASVLTTQGDIPYASAANTPTRLAKGTALQELRMNSGATAPEWFTRAAATVSRSTGQSINDSTNGQIDFASATVEADTGIVDVANDRITVPVSGIYLVTFGGSFAADADGRRSVWFEKGGVQQLPICVVPTTGATGVTAIGISTIIELAASDNLTFFAFHTAGAALDFGGWRIGVTLLTAQTADA